MGGCVVTIDEAWSGDSVKMPWNRIATQNGIANECYHYSSTPMADTIALSAMFVMFAFLFALLTNINSWNTVAGLLVIFPLFPLLFHAPSHIRDYKFRKRLREMKSSRTAVPLTEKTLDELIFNPDIKGCIVGFAASPNNPEELRNGEKFISRGDGCPLMAAYMVFDDSYDQVLFMVKHGIVK